MADPATDPTLSVAPREITDLVFRASRVLGCEASVAERVATAVRCREIEHGCGLSDFLDLANEADALQQAAIESIVPNDSTAEREALASGVAVDASAWARVEALAADFLLSESILDAAES